jgi:hypothetical protein
MIPNASSASATGILEQYTFVHFDHFYLSAYFLAPYFRQYILLDINQFFRKFEHMKMTLEQLRKMDESKMADDDHPFREDITAEEFLEILNASAAESIKVKALNPITDEEWLASQEEMLRALNNSKEDY